MEHFAHLINVAVSFLTVRVSGVNPLLLADLPAGFFHTLVLSEGLFLLSAGSSPLRFPGELGMDFIVIEEALLLWSENPLYCCLVRTQTV